MTSKKLATDLEKGDIIRYESDGMYPAESIVQKVLVHIEMDDGGILQAELDSEYELISKEEFQGLTSEELAEFIKEEGIEVEEEDD